MSRGNDISQEEALEYFSEYAPLFDELDDEGIDYCVVGGLGVMIQGLAKGSGGYRMTVDLDLMIGHDTSAQDLLASYGDAFAETDGDQRTFDAVVVEEKYLEQLANSISDGDNVTLSGFDEGRDGFWAPDIDLCQNLNGYTLGDLERERVRILGHEVTVATVPQLIAMKEKTIEEYQVGHELSSRMQDYIDLRRLRDMQDGLETSHGTPGGR